MKKLLIGAALAVSMLAAAPAANATVVVLPPPGVGGTIAAEFGQAGIGAGPFSHSWEFEFPIAGFASTAVTSIRVNAATDINFTTVTLNGTAFDITNGAFDVATLFDEPVNAGWQTLVIEGMSGGNGEYTVDLAFAPIPEPATWGMMILGFAAAGMAVRSARRRHALAI